MQRRFAARELVLSDTDKHLKRGFSPQQKESVDEFVKGCKKLGDRWNHASFLCHYDNRVLLQALKNVCDNKPEFVAEEIAFAAQSVKVDHGLKEALINQQEDAEKAHEEKLSKGDKLGKKNTQQKTIFDEIKEKEAANAGAVKEEKGKKPSQAEKAVEAGIKAAKEKENSKKLEVVK